VTGNSTDEADAVELNQRLRAPNDDALLAFLNRVDHARRTLSALEISATTGGASPPERLRAA
jgi:hypothetical protein